MYLRIEFADEKPNDKWCLNFIGEESLKFGFPTLQYTIVEED